MKRKLTFILALICFINVFSQTVVWDGTTAIDFGTQATNAGESESNPILISTPQQLRYMANLVSNSTVATADAWKGKCYKMTADFDLNYLAFGRIGGAAGNPTTYQSQTASRPFTGVFDGNGHTILNLSLDFSTASWVALFPYLSGGTIKNLGISSGIIKGINQVAGLVGVSDGVSKIINCYTNCKVISSGVYVGGLAACIYGNTTIDGCYNAGRVSSTVTTVSYFGGLVGQAGKSIDDSPIIKNSYNIGNVICVNGSLGGIVGYSENITMSDCYNASDTLIVNQTQVGNVYLGGLIGRIKRNATIDRCFNVGFITSSADATKSSIIAGISADAELTDLQNDVITINDCYNAGSLVTKGGLLKTLGGIVGVGRTITINNCINYGSLLPGLDDTAYKIGGITANATSDTYTGGPCVINNSFYDKNFVGTLTDVNGTELSTSDLIGSIPSNFDNTIWNSTNNLLPRLQKLKDSSAALVGSVPLTFSNNEKYNTISSQFNLATDNSVTWSSSDVNVVSISGQTATPNLQSSKQTVFITASLNNIKKVIPIVLSIKTGINSIYENSSIEALVYPNPGTVVNVTFVEKGNGIHSVVLDDSYKFSFYNIQGKLLDCFVKTGSNFTFDLSSYPSGTLILKAINSQSSICKRIIKL